MEPAPVTAQGVTAMQIFARGLAIIFFGVLVPIALLFAAYHNLEEVSKGLKNYDSAAELQQHYTSLNKTLASANDYILFSLMYVEQSNQKTMLNKQAMKLTIIYIGFAVMSIGLMFMMLGINDGGGEGGGKLAGTEFNFKTTSTGLIVFIAGALMASGGALLNNQYITAAIPGYIQVFNKSETSNHDKSEKLVALYKSCRKYDEGKFQQCLAAMIKSLYKDELK
jgi:hypothetical protein